MMKILLVDVDRAARKQLRQYLEKQPQHYTLVGEAETMVEAIRQMAKQRPDLVFLALELPGQVGLHLSNLVQELYPDTRIIALAKGQEYAIEALRSSLSGYLLKPLEEQAIEATLKRLVQQEQQPRSHSLSPTNPLPERLLLPSSAGMELIASRDILYLEADGAYTRVHLKNGSLHLSCRPIQHFDYLLEYESFFKSHSSYIIHLQAVRKYSPAEGGQLLLQNGEQLPLSPAQKTAFLQRIQS